MSKTEIKLISKINKVNLSKNEAKSLTLNKPITKKIHILLLNNDTKETTKKTVTIILTACDHELDLVDDTKYNPDGENFYQCSICGLEFFL